MGIPGPDWEEGGWLEVQGSGEGRGVVEAEVGSKPVDNAWAVLIGLRKHGGETFELDFKKRQS